MTLRKIKKTHNHSRSQALLGNIMKTLRGVIVTGIALCFVLPLAAQFDGGEGTEERPWEISRPAHLNNIRGEFLSGHFIQTAHLDLSPEALQDEDWYNQEEGWDPIGIETDNPFTGSYDGDGFHIYGMTTNRPENNRQSLFALLIGATVKNVTMIDVDITCRRDTGGLVGRMDQNSLLINSSATGTLVSPNAQWQQGGLVGYVRGGSIVENCYSEVDVTGGNGRIGGLVGWLRDGHIINSYATGSVTAPGPGAQNVVGGLVGLGGGTITNSYATGEVSGTSELGGLVGNIWGGTVNNSFWDRETTGMDDSSGGGEGRSTQEMIYPYGGDPRTYAEWDFDEIWVHDEDREVNDGYPYLFFMGGEPPVALNPPAVTVELVIINDERHAQLTWQAIEDAASYKVYSTDDLTIEDWGEPVGHTGETSFSEVVDDNRYLFYYVVASVEEAP